MISWISLGRVSKHKLFVRFSLVLLCESSLRCFFGSGSACSLFSYNWIHLRYLNNQQEEKPKERKIQENDFSSCWCVHPHCDFEAMKTSCSFLFCSITCSKKSILKIDKRLGIINRMNYWKFCIPKFPKRNGYIQNGKNEVI